MLREFCHLFPGASSFRNDCHPKVKKALNKTARLILAGGEMPLQQDFFNCLSLQKKIQYLNLLKILLEENGLNYFAKKIDALCGFYTKMLPANTATQRKKRFISLRDFFLGGALMVFCNNYILQFNTVRGSSMEPTFQDGDGVIVDRITPLNHYQRFQDLTFFFPRNPDLRFIKRIAALPGETVEMRNGLLFINGNPMAYPTQIVPDNTNLGPFIVPENTFFVLGDNRPNSQDSRDFGCVPFNLVDGLVRVRYWPLTRISGF